MNQPFVELQEVCRFISGGTPSTKVPEYFMGTIPWITGADMNGNVITKARQYITEEAIQNSATNIVPKGNILLVTRTGVGKVAIAGVDICISQDFTGLELDKTKVDEWFLLYYLRSQEEALTSQQRGATIQGITRDVVETLKLPLPPLTEQKRIASLLARADRLRSLRRTAHDLGESLLQSVFLEMFGDEQKQNYVTIQELMDSEVIIDMQDGNHGGDYPRTSEFVSEGIPFLTATNVIGNRVFLDAAPRLKPERAHKLRIGWVKPNDVLLSHNATVGRVAIMPYFEGEVVLGTSLTYYRLNPEILLPRYFSGLLQSRHFQSQLESFMGQTTRNQVPITRQRELFVPVPPPLNLQEEFAGMVARVESLRGRMSEAGRQVEGLFESLLAKSFGGGR
ncbi:MAG: restriction endonuclease subunit S [Anaerolineales bacterium]|nr:MAG: restriction endonuclease subunit S [Anaerolineales bacterium]